MGKKRLLLVSFDAITAKDARLLLTLPSFGALARQGAFVGDVRSVFVSNTYPAHTSVVTGCHPYKHGILDNTVAAPGDRSPDWNWFARAVRGPTLYGRAGEAGLKVAAVLWPVTAGAGIRWNIPEIFPNRPWKNQILLSLKYGSPLLQMGIARKYGKLMDGIKQPNLDNFVCAAAQEILRTKRPDVMMVHFTDADTNKHIYGAGSSQAMDAIRRMDERLGRLLATLDETGLRQDCHVVVFGDHGMQDVSRHVNPNLALEKAGLLQREQGRVTSWRAWFKCCGGSAFLHLRDATDDGAAHMARRATEELIQTDGGVRRILSDEEMRLSGFDRHCPFGIEAAPGCDFDEYTTKHRANHGYSLDNPGYTTFYLVQGPRIVPGLTLVGGCILDIAPLCATLCGLPLWEMDGRLETRLLKDTP